MKTSKLLWSETLQLAHTAAVQNVRCPEINEASAARSHFKVQNQCTCLPCTAASNNTIQTKTSSAMKRLVWRVYERAAHNPTMSNCCYSSL